MNGLDHVGLTIQDYTRSKTFYEAALASLGLGLVMEVDTPGGKFAGFGTPTKPFFWIGESAGPKTSTHVAFAAASRAEVDAFHAAALAAGATDNGAPGLRPHYHPDYYGAFVLDPDGNNIEAVHHGGP